LVMPTTQNGRSDATFFPFVTSVRQSKSDSALSCNRWWDERIVTHLSGAEWYSEGGFHSNRFVSFATLVTRAEAGLLDTETGFKWWCILGPFSTSLSNGNQDDSSRTIHSSMRTKPAAARSVRSRTT
jgi:hypothetical protein